MTPGRHRRAVPVVLRSGYARALVAAGAGAVLASVVVVATRDRDVPAEVPAVVQSPTAVSTSSTRPATSHPKPQAVPPPPAPPPPPPVVTPRPPVKRVEIPRRSDWDDDHDRRDDDDDE